MLRILTALIVFLLPVVLSASGPSKKFPEGISTSKINATTVETPTLSLDDHASTPSNPSAGFYKVYAKTDGKIYKLNSVGTESEIGTGSGGSGTVRNYAENLYVGDSVLGINRYADSGATPTDGTGGSPNISSAAFNTSTPLRGTANQRLSKDAANRQGEGWSWDFTLDRADYEGGKPITIQFSYKTSANYVSGDLRVFVYDRDSSQLLNVLSLTGDGSIEKSDSATIYTGTFYPNASSDDYRLVVHIAGTNALAWDLDFISLIVSPQKVVPGAIITDWKSYPATGSWSANTTYTAKWRRVGDSMEVEGYITLSGAPTSANLTVNLPSGYGIDTTKLSDPSGTNINIGSLTTFDLSAVINVTGAARYNNTTSVQLLYFADSSGAAGVRPQAITQAAPWTYANGDSITFRFSVPIQVWLASASLSTTEAMISATQVQAVGDPASAAANNPIIFPTKVYDPSNLYNASTGQTIAPRTSSYRIHGMASSSNAGVIFNAYVGGSSVKRLGTSDAGGEITYTGTVRANAGQTIDVRPDATYDAGVGSTLNIEQIPEQSVFSVYGQFELMTATSGIKTPGATGDFHQLTNNSITLTAGTWKLTSSAYFNNGGSNPSYSVSRVGIYSSNGADTSSTPTALSSASGLTVLSVGVTKIDFAAPGSSFEQTGPTTIVRCTGSCTVYVVTSATMTTAANARVTAYMYAERLQ